MKFDHQPAQLVIRLFKSDTIYSKERTHIYIHVQDVSIYDILERARLVCARITWKLVDTRINLINTIRKERWTRTPTCVQTFRVAAFLPPPFVLKLFFLESRERK